MNKNNFILICITIVLISCSKNKNLEINKLSDNLESSITQVLNASNLNEQKSMYRTLDNNEKFALWNRKFELLLLTQKLNSEQRYFIEEIIQNELPKVFLAKKNKDDLVFQESRIKSTAIKLFGVADAFELLCTISGNKVAAGGGNCSCSSTSDWCNTGTYCDSKLSCTTTSGCGTLWQYDCVGICQISGYIPL